MEASGKPTLELLPRLQLLQINNQGKIPILLRHKLDLITMYPILTVTDIFERKSNKMSGVNGVRLEDK